MLDELRQVPWNWVLIRASGLTAWGLLTAVVALGLTTRLAQRRGLPLGRALLLHRWVGTLAMAVLLVHMALLLVDPVLPFTLVEVLVPFVAPWRPLAVGLGIVAAWLLVPAWVLGRMRRRWGDQVFLRAHLLAYAAWPLATAHYVLAGTDALAIWSVALITAGTLVVAAALMRAARYPVAEG